VFLGHFAVGFASKRAAPRASLGALLAAPLLLDLLWPVFLLLGWERVRIDPDNTVVTPLAFVSYPISHSLLAALGWAAAFGLGYGRVTGDRRGAIVIGLAVASHWPLDALVHRPDLPLYPGGSTFVGLGLWNSIPGTLAVELTLFAAGLAVYLGMTRSRDRTGRWALAALVILLLGLYAGSVAGPPPPSPRAVALVDLSGWLVPLWGAWIDRHRTLQRPPVRRAER
jgi:hypothetical protein